MGRIRTAAVKRDSEKIMQVGKTRFGTDFKQNKKTVEEIADTKTKKLRNLIAGYITKKNRAL